MPLQLTYKDTALINDADIAAAAGSLINYLTHLKTAAQSTAYGAEESALALPYDTPLLERVKKLTAEKVTPELKYIFLVGLGGMNLGALAVYEALFGKYDLAAKNRWPKLISLNTLDNFAFKATLEAVNDLKEPDELLINLASLSGLTTETIANFEALLAELKKRFGDGIKSRVVITTNEGSKLWPVAQADGYAHLSVPKTVGGRYSVFSTAGLFPLAVCGVDIGALSTNAREMLERCFNPDISQNPALAGAAVLYAARQKGLRIHNLFLFAPELAGFGQWYRQLLGESIGKEYDRNGTVVNEGILPIISIGSTDLHSVGQLYFGGPKNIFTTFVAVSPPGPGPAVPDQLALGEIVPGIRGKSFDTLMAAIYEGVKKSYLSHNLPFAELVLSDLSPATLGQLLQLKMLETMLLGKLLNLNPFDQPNVEHYKEETRRILR